MRGGAGELDVPETLAAHAGERHFDAALIADDSTMLHALVFAAEAFPVSYRSENSGTEETIALGFEGAIVDRLGFSDFTMRPAPDLLRRGQTDSDRIEVGDEIGSIVRRGTIHELSLNTFLLSLDHAPLIRSQRQILHLTRLFHQLHIE